MRRVLLSALVALAAWTGLPAQELPVLRLKVTLVSSATDPSRPGGQPFPVARYALLISDDPVSAAPRRVVTLADGTGQIRLRPGKYIVESDRPFVHEGRAYEWMQSIEVRLGQDASLELTATNASVSAATDDLIRDQSGEVSLGPAASILTTWQSSVFGLWTPHVHAAGLLADDRGLIATSLRALVLDDPAREAAAVASVEVQISEALKVTGAVVVADVARDVAIVRVHPSAIEGVRPLPVDCNATAASAGGRYVIEVPTFGSKDIESALVVTVGASGGPVFSADGRAVGVSSPAERNPRGRVDVRVIGGDSICEALASARTKLDATAPPDATRLPIEPTRPRTAPTTAAPAGTFRLAPYQLSTSDFDITFVTPALIAAAESRRGWTGAGADSLSGNRVATEFENWSEYVAYAPPLLFVRATPRLVEGFWMKLARGAASTQGTAIPPIKRLRAGFSRMRLLCGGKDVAPIHPFRIQARLTETDAIEEGFYAFDPAAIGPACGALSLVVSSVKDPNKTESRNVDPAMAGRIWDDFARVATP